MSRGPGHVECTIATLFTNNPSATFSTNELVAAVYQEDGPEKKHRVAVLRAAAKVAARLGCWEQWKCERWGQDDLTDRGSIFVNVCDVRSYALGRLRTEQQYQWGDPSGAAKIDSDPRIAELVARGGTWWMFVQQERVKRGAVLDAETARLIETAEAARQKFLESLATSLGGRTPLPKVAAP